MATPIDDIAHVVIAIPSVPATGIEDLLLTAVPEFIGALAAGLVSAVVSRVLQKRRRRDMPEAMEDDSPT